MTDALTESLKWHRQALAQKAISALERNNMGGRYVDTAAEACNLVIDLIPKGGSVAHGGSLTLKQLGLRDVLRRGDYEYLNYRNPDLTEKERHLLHRESIFADVFLMSTNALTLDGRLVNMDGIGNRVSALIYGAGRVIVVAGFNKIVPDVDAAVYRIKNHVAPIHARRRNRKLPCAETGHCMDCHAPDRLCNALVVIEHQYRRNKHRILVIIVGEELGL